jgi:hypothetical protein
MQYRQSPAGVIQFPMEADLINFTRVRNLEASITIPQSLIQERMNNGSELIRHHSGITLNEYNKVRACYTHTAPTLMKLKPPMTIILYSCFQICDNG